LKALTFTKAQQLKENETNGTGNFRRIRKERIY
jgi:hypothetical protein